MYVIHKPQLEVWVSLSGAEETGREYLRPAPLPCRLVQLASGQALRATRSCNFVGTGFFHRCFYKLCLPKFMGRYMHTYCMSIFEQYVATIQDLFDAVLTSKKQNNLLFHRRNSPFKVSVICGVWTLTF